MTESADKLAELYDPIDACETVKEISEYLRLRAIHMTNGNMEAVAQLFIAIGENVDTVSSATH